MTGFLQRLRKDGTLGVSRDTWPWSGTAQGARSEGSSAHCLCALVLPQREGRAPVCGLALNLLCDAPRSDGCYGELTARKVEVVFDHIFSALLPCSCDPASSGCVCLPVATYLCFWQVVCHFIVGTR